MATILCLIIIACSGKHGVLLVQYVSINHDHLGQRQYPRVSVILSVSVLCRYVTTVVLVFQ